MDVVLREEAGFPRRALKAATDPCYSPRRVLSHLLGVRSKQQQTRFGAALACELLEVEDEEPARARDKEKKRRRGGQLRVAQAPPVCGTLTETASVGPTTCADAHVLRCCNGGVRETQQQTHPLGTCHSEEWWPPTHFRTGRRLPKYACMHVHGGQTRIVGELLCATVVFSHHPSASIHKESTLCNSGSTRTKTSSCLT